MVVNVCTDFQVHRLSTHNSFIVDHARLFEYINVCMKRQKYGMYELEVLHKCNMCWCTYINKYEYVVGIKLLLLVKVW